MLLLSVVKGGGGGGGGGGSGGVKVWLIGGCGGERSAGMELCGVCEAN